MLRCGIDMGGSDTRIGSKTGEVQVYPSRVMEIDVHAKAKPDLIDDHYADFKVIKAPLGAVVGRRFVKGAAMHHYDGPVIECTNGGVKVGQDITYINSAYAIARYILENDLQNGCDVFAGVCIPVSEFYDDRNGYVARLKSGLVGSYNIYFPMLDKHVIFNINAGSVVVCPEGVVVASDFKNIRAFVLGKVVIVDMGYRSTDITVLDAFDPMGKTAASRPIGGINLEAAIKSECERDGLFLDADTIRACLCNHTSGSPYIIEGNVTSDITKYVHNRLELMANVIKSEVQSVVNAKMMNMNSIGGVLCIGRPFAGDADDSHWLITLVRKEFGPTISVYNTEDPGLANIKSIIKNIG